MARPKTCAEAIAAVIAKYSFDEAMTVMEVLKAVSKASRKKQAPTAVSAKKSDKTEMPAAS